MDTMSEMQIARLGDLFLVRLVGRGTLQESPAFRDFVASCLDCDTTVIVDLQSCDYLDSTFLGCLIGLNKLRQHCVPPRFLVHADASKRVQLFSTTLLDSVLDFVETLPTQEMQFVNVELARADRRDLAEHIMTCHRRLAELGGAQATGFRSVADRIADELGD